MIQFLLLTNKIKYIFWIIQLKYSNNSVDRLSYITTSPTTPTYSDLFESEFRDRFQCRFLHRPNEPQTTTSLQLEKFEFYIIIFPNLVTSNLTTSLFTFFIHSTPLCRLSERVSLWELLLFYLHNFITSELRHIHITHMHHHAPPWYNSKNNI